MCTPKTVMHAEAKFMRGVMRLTKWELPSEIVTP